MAQVTDELARKSVLVLEDSWVISEGISLQFNLLGFTEVSAVQSLADALEYTEKQLPDIALLDVNLGHGETSFDFAGMLLDRGVTVIFSTGFYDQRNVPAGMRHIVFLTKPFLAEQLEEALMEARK